MSFVLNTATQPANAAQTTNAVTVQYSGTLTGDSRPAQGLGAPPGADTVFSESMIADIPPLRKA